MPNFLLTLNHPYFIVRNNHILRLIPLADVYMCMSIYGFDDTHPQSYHSGAVGKNIVRGKPGPLGRPCFRINKQTKTPLFLQAWFAFLFWLFVCLFLVFWDAFLFLTHLLVFLRKCTHFFHLWLLPFVQSRKSLPTSEFFFLFLNYIFETGTNSSARAAFNLSRSFCPSFLNASFTAMHYPDGLVLLLTHLISYSHLW